MTKEWPKPKINRPKRISLVEALRSPKVDPYALLLYGKYLDKLLKN